MSTRKKPSQTRLNLPQQILKSVQTLTKGLVNWLLRSLLILKRTSRLNPGGFVLPTVVMVMLVVILITTAILFRSFDRSKNASNYRVNEVVLNAATPALDRARAKLERLFSDKENALPAGTPIEGEIASVIEDPRYTFGDETQLKLVNDFNNNGVSTPSPDLEPGEKLRSAWKFPVDTDNNGKFDSFTLYGIYFRTPLPTDNRPRKPLEARGLPQDDNLAGNACDAGSADGGGWFKSGGKLKKAFFIYVANVPITDIATARAGLSTTEANKYEPYKGNKGFSGLEMQQDQARLALDNNAVWYEDDLEITNAVTFRLNGRVHTNGNLLVKAPTAGSERVVFLRVSSPYSCFYDELENSKIEVGGNVANGHAGDTADNTGNWIRADLHDGTGTPPITTVTGSRNPFINTTNKTVTVAGGQGVAYNANAYDKRIGVLTQGAIALFNDPNGINADQEAEPDDVDRMIRYPQILKEDFRAKYGSVTPPLNPDNDLLRKRIENYFRERTRRVPLAEVDASNSQNKAVGKPGSLATTLTSNLTPGTGEEFVFAGGGEIIPPRQWMLIEDPTNGAVATYTNVALKYNATSPPTLDLKATDPTEMATGLSAKEYNIGDRIVVGNGLPTIWNKDGTAAGFVEKEKEEQDVKRNGTAAVKWNDQNGGVATGDRQRISQVSALDDLGDTSRGGFWEIAAAIQAIDPAKPGEVEELAGGLRVVTGAGIFIDGIATNAGGTGQRPSDTNPTDVRSFLPEPPIKVADIPGFTLPSLSTRAIPGETLSNFKVVWPDTMPMWKDVDGDNLIDATPPGITPLPAGTDLKGDLQMRATVVYHYKSGTPPIPDFPIACVSSYYNPTKRDPSGTDAEPNAQSNNGRVYTFQSAWRTSEVPRLRKQAQLIYPNGRLVNAPLRKALQTTVARRTFADKAAIDSAVCALRILGIGGTATPSTAAVPTNAIKEAAFLDARQVKAIHKNVAGTTDNPQRTATQPNPSSDLNLPGGSNIAETPAQLAALTPTPQYSLAIEQRQPLEIRVTEIDLGLLKAKAIGGNTGGAGIDNNQEYLLPNSGIIYASRDDAQPDLSNATDVNALNKPSREQQLASGTDFILDPTRRPNGIRLINGTNLARVSTYRSLEKGLILATNLPVYVKGAFNIHRTSTSGAAIEEFTALTNFGTNADQTGNFYNRGDGGANGDKQLAYGKRQNQPGYTGTDSDQWRAARILADSVTLLSQNFQDGYRMDGDYDQRNNIGNAAVESRLKNGFWWNSFATSANWYETSGANAGFPLADFDPTAARTQLGSSYVKNGVTPIQRRVRTLEYQMEICRKELVSECGPQDWKEAGAGTTATPATALSDRRYPRRVAFERDTDYGVLKVTTTNANSVRPRGISASGAATAIAYGAGATSLRVSDNALWFWSASSNATPNATATAQTYNGSNLLYYPPDELETGTNPQERQLYLPGAPKFPATILPVAARANLASPTVPYIKLNGITTNDPSDYAVCIGGKGNKNYSVGSISINCNAASANIQSVRSALASLAVSPDTFVGAWNGTTSTTLNATKKVNVYDLPVAGVINNGVTLTLSRGNQTNPIFVIRMPASATTTPLTFGNANGGRTLAGFTLNLQGVEPNSVFWVSNAGMAFRRAKHKLVGNFLGSSTGSLRIITAANGRALGQIPAGRFLGFSGLFTGPANPPVGTPATAFPQTQGGVSMLNAMTAVDEPLIVPVLNLHSPQGNPGTTTVAAFGSGEDHLNGKATLANDPKSWVPRAVATTFNAVYVVGDTPSRPIPAATSGLESNGGLPNFPRFLEAWEPNDNANPKTKVVATGSFIQARKSLYGTAPFSAVDVATIDNSLFFDGASPDYKVNYNGAGNPVQYQYRGGAAGRLSSFFRAPERAWGYDVGLLSQSQDLFSRRFATPTAGTPNEFFREVGRDDPWIQTLLCAAQGSGTSYSWVLSPRDRPNCTQPLASYND